jgi:hypothetical protein
MDYPSWNGGLMSYGLFLMRFQGGEAAGMDAALFRRVIAPWVVKYEPEHAFIGLRAKDGGEADLYVVEVDGELGSVMATHFSGGAVLDVVAQLAISLGAVVVLGEGLALAASAEHVRHLPAELGATAQVVEFTGAQIEAAIGCGPSAVWKLPCAQYTEN